MWLDIDFLLGIFIFISLYYIVMSIVSIKSINIKQTNCDLSQIGFVIMVPAHNEELVIGDTVREAKKLPGRFHLVVIDDGSTDRTAEIVNEYVCDNIHLFKRIPPDAGKGKGPALNAAYQYVCQHLAEWFPDLSSSQIAIGVTDSDVFMDGKIIYEVADMFQREQNYGAVQAPVAIRGASTNLWLLMQDMEFMSYFYVIQRARHWISSVAMGGNGQFIRYSAMKLLGERPWSRSLTEDIDIGMQLLAVGQKIAFTGRTPIVQHGLTNFRRLIKQRTRWVQGHYQVWGRLPSIWKARDTRFITKLDSTLYLLMIVMPFFLLADYAFGILSAFGIVHPYSNWLTAMGNITPWLPNVFQLVLSFSIQLVLLPAYYKVTRVSAPFYMWPGIAVLFAMYAAVVWIIASFVALYRIFMGKNNWSKTEREKVSVEVSASA